MKRKPLTVRWRFVNDEPGLRGHYLVRAREINGEARDGPKVLTFYYADIREPKRRYRNWTSGHFNARVLPETVRCVELAGNRNALEMEVIPVVRIERFDGVLIEDDPRWEAPGV